MNISKKAWIIWCIASLFYAYQYILRVMPGIMIEDIMGQFGSDVALFGQFSGIYYIGYSLMHVPVGIMFDRFGPRRVMTFCILLTVAGLIPLLFACSWTYPILGRFLMGLGSSGAILGVFKIIRMTFSEKRFPRMLSLSVMIGLIGAIYGGGPVNYMREMFDYQTVIKMIALSGVVLAAITFWILPNSKKEERGSIVSEIKEVITNWRVVSCCLFAGLMVGPLEGFADVWGTPFLKQVYGFNSTLAASLPSMIFIGMCFGSPLLNFIGERIGYLFTVIGAGVIMTLGFGLLLIGHLTPTLISANFAIIGVCCAYQILAIYKASTYVREGIAGLTTALANMIIMVFGYVFHTIMSAVISSYNISFGVGVIPVGLILGSLGFALLLKKEKLRFRRFWR